MTAHSVRPDGERVNLEADSPAFTELCRASWAVQIGRLVITKSIPFGAVIVYAAACAWRDRGPAFGHPDDEGGFKRTAAAIPPGGWPALAGVTPHTWRRWRAHAVAANLIEILSAGPSQLLRPVAEIEPGEQFARVEIAVLFHRGLSQRARRAFMAVSLFRQSNRFSSVSIRKIGDDAGLERRHVQHALRELESIGALQSGGLTRRGIHRYLVNKAAPAWTLRPPFQESFFRNLLKKTYQELMSLARSRKIRLPRRHKPLKILLKAILLKATLVASPIPQRHRQRTWQNQKAGLQVRKRPTSKCRSRLPPLPPPTINCPKHLNAPGDPPWPTAKGQKPFE